MSFPAFILIAGAFHGGWCWFKIAERLTKAGHRVYAPSLSGLADRAHLARAGLTATDQVQDILSLIEYEQLSGAVLVAHSYGGLVATAVADKVPERFCALIFCDGVVAEDGKSLIDLIMPGQEGVIAANAARDGQGWRVPPVPAAHFDIADSADVALVDRLCTPQPIGTMLERLPISGGWKRIPSLVYVLGAKHRPDLFRSHSHRLRDDPAWAFHELQCGHHAMLDVPDALAKILLETANKPAAQKSAGP